MAGSPRVLIPQTSRRRKPCSQRWPEAQAENSTVPQTCVGEQSINTPKRLCMHHLLLEQAERSPDTPAILAPGRAPLTYGRLWQHIEHVLQALRAMGLGRQDRVGLMLPNGAEMAVAFLAVAAGATCAPLNPAYSADELASYLAQLHAKALIVQTDMDT